MALQFVKATKHQSKARIAIDGPSGSGKTYTALIAATVLADGGKIAVVDTECGSASLYSDKFNFDVLEITSYSPLTYVEAIHAAENGGYAVIVLDSLSHAWEGEGGVLEIHDKETIRSQGNSYTAWKNVTPIQRKLIDAMLKSKCHVIATMRSKMEYSQEKDEKTGKTVVKKIGLAPIQRQGMEYEFTIVADMDTDHNIIISKSRCEFMADRIEKKPDSKFFAPLSDWLKSGEAEEPKKAEVETEKTDDKETEKKAEVTNTETQVREIVIWDGKTLKPADGTLDIKTINTLNANMVGDGKEFSAHAHLKNHLRKHFHVDTLQEMTWEKANALVLYVKSKHETKDSRWYADEAVVAKAEPQSPEPTEVPNVGVDMDAVAKLAFGDKQEYREHLDTLTFSRLTIDEQAQVLSACELVSKGVMDAKNVTGIADLAKLG